MNNIFFSMHAYKNTYKWIELVAKNIYYQFSESITFLFHPHSPISRLCPLNWFDTVLGCVALACLVITYFIPLHDFCGVFCVAWLFAAFHIIDWILRTVHVCVCVTNMYILYQKYGNFCQNKNVCCVWCVCRPYCH